MTSTTHTHNHLKPQSGAEAFGLLLGSLAIFLGRMLGKLVAWGAVIALSVMVFSSTSARQLAGDVVSQAEAFAHVAGPQVNHRPQPLKGLHERLGQQMADAMLSPVDAASSSPVAP
jgi:hypothetical protein